MRHRIELDDTDCDRLSMARYIIDACVARRAELPFVISKEELRDAGLVLSMILADAR